MTQVTQENLRSILPGKIARTIMLISEEEKSSVKNALLKFYKSSVYKELEIEQTKRWWQSSLQLFEDFVALS
ncbi:MAG: hypothetical protein II507_11755 [Treponema sp.]|jgi:hypothetical protein|nr:hypothetical protein [Treponema sp.]MBP5436478.1 hypothetical protein [Treponema sp.]MBP5577438.1 hypothetical protein [Treponema sp.]MBQ2465637.1 hypothetical protein [Treponema sp.]MBQ5449802.1 hypothetical protein [Treponema sp.]